MMLLQLNLLYIMYNLVIKYLKFKTFILNNQKTWMDIHYYLLSLLILMYLHILI